MVIIYNKYVRSHLSGHVSNGLKKVTGTFALLLAALPALVGSQPPLTAKQIYERCRGSVVSIEAEGPEGKFTGTGFIYVNGNMVATALHVIGKATKVTVRARDGRTWKPYLLFIDRSADTVVIMLDADSGLKPIPHAPSDTISVGDPVYVIGDPLGLTGSLSSGVVGALRQSKDTPLVQITAPISHGSSGGPVLDAQGRAIGIVSFTFSEGQNLNMAVSTKVAKALMQSDTFTDSEHFYSANQPQVSAKDKGTDAKPTEPDEIRVRMTQELAKVDGALMLAYTCWDADFIAATDEANVVALRRLDATKKRFDDAVDIDALGRVVSLGKQLKLDQRLLLNLVERSTVLFKFSYERLAADKRALMSESITEEERTRLVEASFAQHSRMSSALQDMQNAMFALGLDAAQVAEQAEIMGPISILKGFRACPDPDLPDSPMLLPTALKSRIKAGDLLLGVAAGKGEFVPIKDWKTAHELWLNKVKRGFKGPWRLKIKRIN